MRKTKEKAWILMVWSLTLPLLILGLMVNLYHQMNQVNQAVQELDLRLQSLNETYDDFVEDVSSQMDVLGQEVESLKGEVEALNIKVGSNQKQATVVTRGELEAMAKVLYHEARGEDTTQQSAVVWCILNRLDHGGYGDSIMEVVTSPHQFAWHPDAPVQEDLLWVVTDVVSRWNWEKQGLKDSGRTLPSTYLYFTARDGENKFTEEFGGTGYWDWSLPSPY